MLDFHEVGQEHMNGKCSLPLQTVHTSWKCKYQTKYYRILEDTKSEFQCLVRKRKFRYNVDTNHESIIINKLKLIECAVSVV